MTPNFFKIFLKTNFFALFDDFFIIYWLQLKIFFYLCTLEQYNRELSFIHI